MSGEVRGDTLAGLIARLEAATGPDLGLASAILEALNPYKDGPYASWRAAAMAFGWNTDITGSGEAALGALARWMTLERSGGFTVQSDLRHAGPRGWSCRLEITIPSREFQGFAYGPDLGFVTATATLIALLRAAQALNGLRAGQGVGK